MTDLRKAAEMALEALENVYGKGKRCEAAIQALRQALAQPEQEPVVYLDEGLGAFYWPNEYALLPHKDFTPLYTAPPKREWVGLTDDDVHDAFNYVEMVKLLDFDRDRPEWCASLTQLLACNPPRPAPCNCKPKPVDAVNISQERVDETAKRNCDNCESLRRAAWDRINELEAKLEERENNVLFNDVLKSFKLYADSLGIKLKEKNT